MSNKTKFDWSKWGFWLALFLFLITCGMWIYQTYIFEKKPKLSFEIISNEEVLTVSEDIDSLKIEYQGIDLRKNNQNLSLLTFRVVNNGNSSILKSFYDSDVPVGFLIKNGQLLKEPEIIASNDYDYFKNYLGVIRKDSVVFNPLIIDSKKYFDLKCLVLNRLGEKVGLESFGKIANTDSIEIRKFTKEESSGLLTSVLMVTMGLLLGWYSDDIKRFLIKKIINREV